MSMQRAAVCLLCMRVPPREKEKKQKARPRSNQHLAASLLHLNLDAWTIPRPVRHNIRTSTPCSRLEPCRHEQPLLVFCVPHDAGPKHGPVPQITPPDLKGRAQQTSAREHELASTHRRVACLWRQLLQRQISSPLPFLRLYPQRQTRQLGTASMGWRFAPCGAVRRNQIAGIPTAS